MSCVTFWFFSLGPHRPFFFGFFEFLLLEEDVVDGRDRADWADVSERNESTVAVDGVATSLVSSFGTDEAGLTSSVTAGLSSSGSPCDKRNYGDTIKYGSRLEHSCFPYFNLGPFYSYLAQLPKVLKC